MSDYEYTGPRIPRTRKNEALARLRFHREVESIVAFRFDEALKAWAVVNEGRFPDKDEITREVIAELETLCRALDGWGAVPPDTILGPDWKYELGDLFD